MIMFIFAFRLELDQDRFNINLFFNDIIQFL